MNCRLCEKNKIKYDKLKLCNVCSKDKLIIKTNAKNEYALSDKDMSNIEHNVVKLGFGRKCNLYFIGDVEDYAINKYGSKDAYKEKVKRKQELKESRERKKENLKNNKMIEMKECLKEVGLAYRHDSELIEQYINGKGEYSKEDIRYILLEMNFYYKHTNYSEKLKINRQKAKNDEFGKEYWMYKYWNDENEDDVREDTKEEVLKEFIKANKNKKDKMILIPMIMNKKVSKLL